MEITTVFDYAQLDTETRIVVKQRTLEIRAQIKHSAHAVADIGEKLIDVRSKLLEGYFDAWLRAEFGWTKTTAYRFIRVAEQFGSNNLLLDNAAPSALYLLAEPSTPESIRQEFIEEAEAGKPVKHRDVKSRVKTGGIPKTTIKPKTSDTGIRVESQINRSAPLVDSQELETPPTHCLELACDENTWRTIKRTFNDPVWAGQVLAAAANLSESELAEALGIERQYSWD